MKYTIALILILATFTIFCCSFPSNIVKAQSMTIHITPEITTAEPGTDFTVELNIRDAERIYTWGANITWNPEILSFTAVTEGSFLNQEGTRRTDFIYGVNSTAGWLYFGCTLLGEPSAAQPTGSGTLAQITFTVLRAGETPLHFSEFRLWNYWKEISPSKYTVEDGLFKFPYFTVSVTPSTISNPQLTANTTFNVNITVFVENLYRWYINLTWNLEVLEMINATEGAFLTSGGYYSSNFTYTIYQEKGFALLNSTLLEPALPANGTGVLATITFRVKMLGESEIRLEQVLLYDDKGEEILHGVFHCKFSNILHDVAIESIDALISDNKVTIGETITINVTLRNNGNIAETIELKLYYGVLVIDTRSGSLKANETKTFSFTWDTSGLTEGEGELKAIVTPLPEEASTDNNVKVFGVVTLQKAPSGPPLTLIVAAVVIIIVILIAVFMVLKKLKR